MKAIQYRDAVYFAGLFDGEGCVNICERHPRHAGPGQVSPYFRCEISLSNTHYGVMLWIEHHIGGILVKPARQKPKKDGTPRKTCWRWSASQKETANILTQIHPWMIVKKEQALLALRYYEVINKFIHNPHPGRIGKLRTSPNELKIRRNFLRQMQALNHPDRQLGS